MKYIHKHTIYNPIYRVLELPTVKFNHGDATIIIQNGYLRFKTGKIDEIHARYNSRREYYEEEREHCKRMCLTCSFMPCFGLGFKIDPSTIDAKTMTIDEIICPNCHSSINEIKSNDIRVVYLDVFFQNIDKILPYFNNDCKEKIVNYVIENYGIDKFTKFSYETPLFIKMKYYLNFASHSPLPEYNATYFEHIPFVPNKVAPVLRKLNNIYKLRRNTHNEINWQKFHINNPECTASFIENKCCFKDIRNIYTLLPYITNKVIFSFAVNRIVKCHRIGNLYSIFDVYTSQRHCSDEDNKNYSRNNKNNLMKCEKQKSRYDFLKYYFDKNKLTTEQNKELWNLIIELKAYKLIKELRDLNIIYPCDKFTFILTEMNEKIVPNHEILLRQ